MSMKLTPNSTLRRSTRTAESGSLGGPQIPSPVMRMAPKPRRRTFNSPPSAKVPLRPAGGPSAFPACSFISISRSSLQVTIEESSLLLCRPFLQAFLRAKLVKVRSAKLARTTMSPATRMYH